MATVAPPQATSAAGLLSLLAEPDPALQAAALARLDAVVGSFWFQVADSLSAIEARAEDDAFEHRELAALVASKVRENGGECVCVCGVPAGGNAGRTGAGGRCADTDARIGKKRGPPGPCAAVAPAPFPRPGAGTCQSAIAWSKKGDMEAGQRSTLPTPFFNVRPSPPHTPYRSSTTSANSTTPSPTPCWPAPSLTCRTRGTMCRACWVSGEERGWWKRIKKKTPATRLPSAQHAPPPPATAEAQRGCHILTF